MRSATLLRRLAAAWLLLAPLLCGAAAQTAPAPPEEPLPAVAAPPEAFFARFLERDREAARAFYKKHLQVKGLHVAAGAAVADEALLRTHHLVSRMLAGRPDILAAMAEHGTRLIIIGKDQVYTDMPEYRRSLNAAFMNERVRGTGGLDVTSFGEENLLNLPLDRYDDESIAVHEFCHTIDAALRRIDPGWRARLGQAYQNAVAKGLWKNTYAATNAAEYWAELAQSYLDCNRVNNWNHGPIGTREQLKAYDPEGHELAECTFKFTPATDWRFQPLRRQPSVIAPPPQFQIAPRYTKFTWAREFPVVGSPAVSEAALLKANDLIRKMFAYRHDLLKTLIADGAKLVVLAPNETLADLPELKGQSDLGAARSLDYAPKTKLLVVPEENLLGLKNDPYGGECRLIALFAKAFRQTAGLRPADPEFEKKRDKQQYELRVKRLDATFDEKLRQLHEAAAAKGIWNGTPAAADRADYWAAGVVAYFDAGPDQPPPRAARPIFTRAALKEHDPDLFALVEETMGYRERIDWRFRPPPQQTPAP